MTDLQKGRKIGTTLNVFYTLYQISHYSADLAVDEMQCKNKKNFTAGSTQENKVSIETLGIKFSYAHSWKEFQ